MGRVGRRIVIPGLGGRLEQAGMERRPEVDISSSHSRGTATHLNDRHDKGKRRALRRMCSTLRTAHEGTAATMMKSVKI